MTATRASGGLVSLRERGHGRIGATWYGRRSYGDGLQIQESARRRVHHGEDDGELILLEHDHVVSLGRRAGPEDVKSAHELLERSGVQVVESDRGGRATYHGPGQLVGYPVLDLRGWRLSVADYVRSLQEMLVDALRAMGVQGRCDDVPTGVWVGDAKIAAIGVRVSRGITSHGFALNVRPDLGYFEHIVPCGIPEMSVTSLANEGTSISLEQAVEKVSTAFERQFALRSRGSARGASPRDTSVGSGQRSTQELAQPRSLP